MVSVNMHLGKQHNHISSSLSFPLVSGFRSLGVECPHVVASRRPLLGNMHHEKQVTNSSSSLPLTLVSGFGEFGEGCPTMVASRRSPLLNMHHDTGNTQLIKFAIHFCFWIARLQREMSY